MRFTRWQNEMKERLNEIDLVPDEEWALILPLFKHRKLKKGDYFLPPGGGPSHETAYILSGGVRHYFINRSETECTTDFCRKGEFTGIPDSGGNYPPRHIIITAFEDSELAVTDQETLEGFIRNHSAFQNLYRKIVMQYFAVKTAREADFLCRDLTERYENFLMHYPALSVPQYQIASFLGMTPETLSRIRSRR